jgi:hypothetical protein
MVCPYCNFEYTADQPCFCLPILNPVVEEQKMVLPLEALTPDQAVCWNTSRGNRID